MSYNLYTVFDSVSGTYGNPFCAMTDDEAKRMFKCDYDRVLNQSPSSPFAMFIGDYELRRVGSFDCVTGLVATSGMNLVLSGRSLLAPDDK